MTEAPNHFNPELYIRRHYVPTLEFSAANIHTVTRGFRSFLTKLTHYSLH